jgi:hypothetical protein
VRTSRRLAWNEPGNPLAAREAIRRAAGAPLVDLTLTNPTRAGLDYPAEAIAQALADPRAAAYDPAPLGLAAARAAVAAAYAEAGAAVGPDRVALTASSSESYGLLFKLLCDPGDVVLVPAPSYPLFDLLARLEGVVPRPYRLAFDGAWHVDWRTVDVEGARAIVVVSPNNPTGSFLTTGDLALLEALGLPLVVDEVFGAYPLAPPRDAVRTIVGQPLRRPLAVPSFALGGLSKSCGLPQLKLGWIAVGGPEAEARTLLEGLELVADTYLSVGAPVQHALPRLLALGAGIRAQIAGRVRRNREALAAAVGRDSPCTLLPAEAGWSAILRLPAVRSDEAWALTLLDEDDLLVQPGYFYDLELPACLVLSLLPAPDLFDEGIRRLAARVSATVG